MRRAPAFATGATRPAPILHTAFERFRAAARRARGGAIALACCLAVPPAVAAEPSPPGADALELERELERRIALAVQEGVVEGSDRARALALWREARDALGLARSRDAGALAGLDAGPPDAELDEAALAARLAALRALRLERLHRRETALAALERLELRERSLPGDIVRVRLDGEDPSAAVPADAGADDDDGAADTVAGARRLLRRARDLERAGAAEGLAAELASLPDRRAEASATLREAELALAALERRIDDARDRLAGLRTARLGRRLALAHRALARASAPGGADAEASADGADASAVAEAAETLELHEVLLGLVGREAELDRAVARAQARAREVRDAADTIERVLDVGLAGDDPGALLRRLRDGLPEAGALDALLEDSVEALERLQLRRIVHEDRLRELRAARGRAGDGDAPDPRIDALAEATRTLSRLVERERARGIALTESLERVEDVDAVLGRRLLWLRSGAAYGVEWFAALAGGTARLVDPARWRAVGADVAARAGRKPLTSLFALLLPYGLWKLRGPLRRLELANDARVGDVGRDAYHVTPLALGYALLRTLPLPAFLAACAALLSGASSPHPFTAALVPALLTLAALLAVLGLFRSASRPGGLFERHFGWDEAAAARLHADLHWFLRLEALAAFAFAFTASGVHPDLHRGIGTLAFVAASVGLALFAWRLLDPRRGTLVVALGRGAGSVPLGLACLVLVAAPLGVGLLPLAGWLDAGVELQSRVFRSAVALLGTVVVYGVAMRLYAVAWRRFALRAARERRRRIEAERAQRSLSAGSGEAMPSVAADAGPDPELVGAQARATLQGVSILVLGAWLWVVWSPLLPALGIAEELVLWRGTSVLDGVETVHAVTLWDVATALLLFVGGALAARNVRGLLEVGLFQRLRLDPGARFAIVTIAGYALIGVALVAGAARLDIDWSKLQWIVAALGVGLGFGLQEIVANFVSGLIILFERPVRVGDTVTIGQLSGTVSAIRIRATTITDFDNREVMLPNKSIITENVTNWTLHDETTRLVLSVGVAYGSDIEAVRAALLGVAESHPDVLGKPAPTVFFVAHGDSALLFETRAFVDSPAKRLPVTHDLNAAANAALAAIGVTIPFPQVDVHVAPGAAAPVVALRAAS